MEGRQAVAALIVSASDEGKRPEELIRLLRSKGYSIGESCVAIAEGLEIDLDRAQKLVAESETWADHSEAHQLLTEAVRDALEEIGEVDEDGSIRVNLSDLDQL
jgi:hypothetical protein